jgi:hypothetical protein
MVTAPHNPNASSELFSKMLQRHNMTINQLVVAIRQTGYSINDNTLHDIRSGQSKTPRMTTMQVICDAMNEPIWSFYPLLDPRQSKNDICRWVLRRLVELGWTSKQLIPYLDASMDTISRVLNGGKVSDETRNRFITRLDRLNREIWREIGQPVEDDDESVQTNWTAFQRHEREVLAKLTGQKPSKVEVYLPQKPKTDDGWVEVEGVVNAYPTTNGVAHEDAPAPAPESEPAYDEEALPAFLEQPPPAPEPESAPAPESERQAPAVAVPTAPEKPVVDEALWATAQVLDLITHQPPRSSKLLGLLIEIIDGLLHHGDSLTDEDADWSMLAPPPPLRLMSELLVGLLEPSRLANPAETNKLLLRVFRMSQRDLNDYQSATYTKLHRAITEAIEQFTDLDTED